MAGRDAILDAAYEILVAHGWGAARMADIAARAGVSRQTLYNAHGSKEGLARAVLLRETTRYLDGVAALLDRHAGDPERAVEATVLFTLTEVGDNPLLEAVLTASADEDLLPLVTTRSDWLLAAARDVVARSVRGWPGLSTEDVELLADATVRLTVSHLVTPTGPAELTARRLARLVARFVAGGAP
jgi:AcrR family transcriptional regulator